MINARVMDMKPQKIVRWSQLFRLKGLNTPSMRTSDSLLRDLLNDVRLRPVMVVGATTEMQQDQHHAKVQVCIKALKTM